MKSLKDYSMNLSEEEYHAHPAWNHSKIVRYAKEGFASIAKIDEPVASTASMEFGSLVDSIVTRGPKTLDNYAVVDTNIPDAEKKALDYVASKYGNTPIKLHDIPQEQLMRYCDECGYQKRWGYDARFSHLEPFDDYFASKCSGKKVVSQKDWNDAVTMAKTLWSKENTKDLFKRPGLDGNIEYLYQTQLETDIPLDNGAMVPVRVMFDLLVVNHAEKTILPVDLKTSSVPGFDFAENFIKFRYDIEASMYSDVLSLVIGKIPEYKDYTILPFVFADISRSDMEPVTYVYNPYEESQINGLSYKGYQYKRWDTLLQEIVEYKATNATVPNYITLSGTNDLVEILNTR